MMVVGCSMTVTSLSAGYSMTLHEPSSFCPACVVCVVVVVVAVGSVAVVVVCSVVVVVVVGSFGAVVVCSVVVVVVVVGCFSCARGRPAVAMESTMLPRRQNKRLLISIISSL